MTAVNLGRPKVIKILLSMPRIDLDVRDIKGRTAYDFTGASNIPELKEAYEEKWDKEDRRENELLLLVTDRTTYTRKDKLKAIKDFLEDIKDDNERKETLDHQTTHNQMTALMYAALDGDEKLYRYLLDQGANPDLLSKENKNARQYYTGDPPTLPPPPTKTVPVSTTTVKAVQLTTAPTKVVPESTTTVKAVQRPLPTKVVPVSTTTVKAVQQQQPTTAATEVVPESTTTVEEVQPTKTAPESTNTVEEVKAKKRIPEPTKPSDTPDNGKSETREADVRKKWFEYASTGNVAAMETLLNTNPELLNAKNDSEYGRTALMIAAVR